MNSDVRSIDRFSVNTEWKQNRRITVSFRWDHDRFRHDVFCESHAAGDTTEDAHRVCIAESCEGDDAANWPSSPPIQQLDHCALAGGVSGLVGLGMAGNSHWSLAVEPRADHIRFEFACRATRKIEWLGSTYRLSASDIPIAAPPTEIGEQGWCVRPVAAQLQLQPDEATILPNRLAAELPATIVWSYEWALGPGSRNE